MADSSPWSKQGDPIDYHGSIQRSGTKSLNGLYRISTFRLPQSITKIRKTSSLILFIKLRMNILCPMLYLIVYNLFVRLNPSIEDMIDISVQKIYHTSSSG